MSFLSYSNEKWQKFDSVWKICKFTSLSFLSFSKVIIYISIFFFGRFVVDPETRLCSWIFRWVIVSTMERVVKLRLSGRKRNRKREEKEETVKEMGFMLREIRNWSREDSHRFLPLFFLIRLIVLMDLSFFFLRLAAFVQDRYF